MDEKTDIHHQETAAAGSNDDLQKSTTVDTVHNDEAVKVLAHYSGDQTWTELEEKKLRRKIDRRLLSILCITYGLQYYDKAMLSQAVSTCNKSFMMFVLITHLGSLRITYRS
jgi:hypothetical protein